MSTQNEIVLVRQHVYHDEGVADAVNVTFEVMENGVKIGNCIANNMKIVEPDENGDMYITYDAGHSGYGVEYEEKINELMGQGCIQLIEDALKLAREDAEGEATV